jgi:hypothetical protein
VLKLYNQGMDLEEAATRVKKELSLTYAMIVKALDLAWEDVGLKFSEVRESGEISKLRREGEEASRRVLEGGERAHAKTIYHPTISPLLGVHQRRHKIFDSLSCISVKPYPLPRVHTLGMRVAGGF